MEVPTDSHLEIEEWRRDDGTVLALRLDRPEKLNALPFSTIETLAATFERVDRDRVDAVVLRGAGGNFCGGMDVEQSERRDFTDPERGGRVHDAVAAVREAPVPVVAAVEGKAYGAGFFLCMAADLVVAAGDAEFALPEVRLGMPTGGYAPALLPRLVGERRAREWLLTGAPVGAAAAERAGFVTDVVDDGELDDAVDELLTAMRGNSGLAMMHLKRQLASPVADLEAARERELDAMRDAWADGDVAERIDDLF